MNVDEFCHHVTFLSVVSACRLSVERGDDGGGGFVLRECRPEVSCEGVGLSKLPESESKIL